MNAIESNKLINQTTVHIINVLKKYRYEFKNLQEDNEYNKKNKVIRFVYEIYKNGLPYGILDCKNLLTDEYEIEGPFKEIFFGELDEILKEYNVDIEGNGALTNPLIFMQWVCKMLSTRDVMGENKTVVLFTLREGHTPEDIKEEYEDGVELVKTFGLEQPELFFEKENMDALPPLLTQDGMAYYQVFNYVWDNPEEYIQ